MSYDLVIQGRFVDPIDGEFSGSIGISNGNIERITEENLSGTRRLKLADSDLVLPGFIDTHVHFREPGWEHKGDIRTESLAAAAGGVTTAMEMPNTYPATTSRERVLEKIGIAKRKSAIDLLFYGGIGPGNIYTLERMVDVVPAFKLYMCESTGNLQLDDMGQIEEAFSQVAGTGKPLAVHCENQGINSNAARKLSEGKGNMAHALSRPPESEVKAIEDALRLARKHGVKLSVCHVSTRQGLELIMKDGKARSEATIHHSIMDTRDLERLGTLVKMNPPLRDDDDSEFILDSLRKGDIDFIGTDHAPHIRQEKLSGIIDAPSGVPSVEHYGQFACLLLSRGMEPKGLAGATSYNAAKFFGLEGKGRIEEGYLADLTILDTGGKAVVKPPYHAKCRWSPLEGMKFPGSVSHTIRRGKIIFERGRLRV